MRDLNSWLPYHSDLYAPLPNHHTTLWLSLVTLLIYHIYHSSFFYFYLSLGVKWDWGVHQSFFNFNLVVASSKKKKTRSLRFRILINILRGKLFLSKGQNSNFNNTWRKKQRMNNSKILPEIIKPHIFIEVTIEK